MDGIIQMMPPFMRKYSTYIDFEGQRKAERIFQVILVVHGIVGFIAGYATQQLSVTMYSIGVGFILSCLFVLPPWPMFRRNSLNWQPNSPAEAIASPAPVPTKTDTKETSLKKTCFIIYCVIRVIHGVVLNRKYCNYPTNGGEGGANGGNSGDGYKIWAVLGRQLLSRKRNLTRCLVQFMFPLFPGFGKRVQIVKDEVLKDLLRRKVKCKQPYVGVFVKKDDNDDSESVSSISKLYTVGSFATITDFHDHGDYLVLGIAAHRRIRILEPIEEKVESSPSSTTTQMSKLNGRRTKIRNKEAEKVEPTPNKTIAEGAEGVVYARTENIITEKFERTNEIKASMSAVVQAIRDIVNYSPSLASK
uniref:Signal peptidase complex subunit 1 n=1 Tax=Ditylenchus dipsaci TaxID=166011 RepID=A0A915DGU4_9BILA